MKLLKFKDINNLEKVNELLHDSVCDLDLVEFDKQNKQFIVNFEREGDDYVDLGVSKKIFFFFNRIEYPKIKTKLIIQDVEDCTIADKSKIGCYMLNKIKRIKNQITFDFCEDLSITLYLSSTDINYIFEDVNVIDQDEWDVVPHVIFGP